MHMYIYNKIYNIHVYNDNINPEAILSQLVTN